MLLAIDIGNTSIHVGVFSGRTLRRQFSLPTRLARNAAALRRRLRISGAKDAIVCSVVPWATTAVTGALRATGIRPVVVGRTLRVPLTNRYRYPKQVGQDRLLGAYAAKKYYGTPAIVIDLGTAITLDVVSSQGEYLGGVIVPGIRLSAESLFRKTALLPKIKIKGIPSNPRFRL